MDPEDFRAAGHRLVDWIADFRTGVADRPVEAQVGPGEVRERMPADPPPPVADFEDLLGELDRVVLPGMTHVQHPRYFGFFPANASLTSVLADMASTGLGGLGISWQSNPALTEVEEVACDWYRQLTGLSDAWHGTIHDTASTACLVALLCARERATKLSQYAGGLQAQRRPLVVYASEQAHSSVTKAALLAGYGASNLRLIGVDGAAHAMKPDRFEAAITGTIFRGEVPAAVVVTIGTTTTAAIDPLLALVRIAKRYGAWVHVDAAMAGSAMLLPECRHLWEGVEEADSISWNPHKWLGAALDCSLFYVRDPAELTGVMSTNPSYLQSHNDGDVVQYRDWGIPLGRRFRALKLWFLLALDGVDALQARLRRDLANAQWLAEQVDAAELWHRLAPVELQTVCVRHEPPELRPKHWDDHTLRWVRALNGSGAAYITPARLDDHWMARVSIGAEATTRDDVAATWDRMQELAEEARR